MYTMERFDEDTAIIQKDGADVVNVTKALLGPGVELLDAEREAILDAIAAALVKLNEEAGA